MIHLFRKKNRGLNRAQGFSVVSPRVVPLPARQVAENMLISGLKGGLSGDMSPTLEDPTNPPALYLDSDRELPTALVSHSTQRSVPVSLGEEIQEILSVRRTPPNPATPIGPTPPIRIPESDKLGVSARLESLASLGLPVPVSGNRKLLSRVETEEVALLTAQGVSGSSLKALVTSRMISISPDYYKGIGGVVRKNRLWWLVYRSKVFMITGGVILGCGVLALCIFVPVAGIVVVANIVLITSAAAASSSNRVSGRGN